ncbi:MAG TPA: efflux RND transporter periplasmic adaptor subunit, partial [Candidatus Parcubacteria bacterium]|nr:efflux RND transporter periplasmic adaptor subunit [Candidatus Parcubacteria bacterium]
NAQQIITAAKINKKKSVDAAKASVVSLEDELSEDGVYQAQISQAKAAIEALKNKISKSVLTAPGRGQIIDIKKKEGEVVQPIDTVISFLPAEKFQIDVDIYEEDIVKVKVGQPVDISLTAFPDKIIKGRVVSINPAQKIIDGVVYYTVTISFLEEVDGVKPGMTADVTIIVAEKDNVLLAPKEAVESMDGKEDVRVYNNGKTEKREIKTGLEGEDFYEVVSGLKEGEMVVVGKKS